jgi:hypothetical protein
MQKEVQLMAQALLQIVGIPQILVIGDRAALHVVVHHAEAKPAALLKRLEPIREPA